MAKNDYVRQMQRRKAMIEWQQAKMEELAATKAAERALWIAIVAVHTAYKKGKDSIYNTFIPAFHKATAEYEADLRQNGDTLHSSDRDYADGKLEQKIQAILGIEVSIGGGHNGEVTVDAKNLL